MSTVVLESGMSIQGVKHQRPGKYVQEILGNPTLNPFLFRVRSRDYQTNTLQVYRHTVIWLYESLFPQIMSTLPTRRCETDKGSILEQVYVIATSHSGLQKGPRRFDRMTQIAQQALN